MKEIYLPEAEIELSQLLEVEVEERPGKVEKGNVQQPQMGILEEEPREHGTVIELIDTDAAEEGAHDIIAGIPLPFHQLSERHHQCEDAGIEDKEVENGLKHSDTHLYGVSCRALVSGVRCYSSNQPIPLRYFTAIQVRAPV